MATLQVEGIPGVRVLIATGVLVRQLALFTLVAPDGAIEIIYLEIDDST